MISAYLKCRIYFLLKFLFLKTFVFFPLDYNSKRLCYQWECEDTERLPPLLGFTQKLWNRDRKQFAIFLVGSQELTCLFSSWIAQQGPGENALSGDVLFGNSGVNGHFQGPSEPCPDSRKADVWINIQVQPQVRQVPQANKLTLSYLGAQIQVLKELSIF